MTNHGWALWRARDSFTQHPITRLICSLPLVPLLPLSVSIVPVVKASFGRVRPFLGRVASRKLGRNSARRLDPYSPQDWTSRLVLNHGGSSQLRT